MSVLIHCAWHRVCPFNLEIHALQFEIFLITFKNYFFALIFCVLLFSVFGLLNLLDALCFTISVSCYNFWEFPPTFIFPAFSSTIMFSLYRSSFVLKVLFFRLITSCYFMGSKSYLSEKRLLACFLPYFLFFLNFLFPM